MLNEFIRYLEAERRYSELTIRNYRSDILRFVAWKYFDTTPSPSTKAHPSKGLSASNFADTRPSPKDEEEQLIEGFSPTEISADDLRRWIIYRTEGEKISPQSMNRELSSLRALFKWLLRTGRITSDVTRQIPSLRTAKRLPQFVPETRMKPLVEQCEKDDGDFTHQRDQLIILLFYTCGLRLAELVGINREDFTADYTSLKVLGKGDKERIVPILEFVREKILHYLRTIDDENICFSTEKALFLTHKGRRISRTTVYRIVQRTLGAAGVQGKKSPHVLRHTFATHLLNGGADMREIQELLGHSSLEATQVYTHNNIARLREIYTKAHPHEKGGK